MCPLGLCERVSVNRRAELEREPKAELTCWWRAQASRPPHRFIHHLTRTADIPLCVRRTKGLELMASELNSRRLPMMDARAQPAMSCYYKRVSERAKARWLYRIGSFQLPDLIIH